MKLVIIYGAGNIQSLRFALDRLGVESLLSSNADEIKKADKVIFPGVGEASTAMKKLGLGWVAYSSTQSACSRHLLGITDV